MSFNTNGHVVYLTNPNKSSPSHALVESNGLLTVFSTVPSGEDLSELESSATVVPEPLVRGRVVG